jgi:hypothetical protein
MHKKSVNCDHCIQAVTLPLWLITSANGSMYVCTEHKVCLISVSVWPTATTNNEKSNRLLNKVCSTQFFLLLCLVPVCLFTSVGLSTLRSFIAEQGAKVQRKSIDPNIRRPAAGTSNRWTNEPRRRP